MTDNREERELIASAKRDPAAFGMLYDLHVDAVYNYIAHRVGHGPEAEDLTGQVFLRALAGLPRYEWQGVPFRHWLYRIASHAVSSYWRTRRPQAPLAEADRQAVASPPEERVEEEELCADLRRFVRDLPDQQQAAVVLRYGQELSYKDIAVIMGKSENAVKQLVHRALVSLRQRLGG